MFGFGGSAMRDAVEDALDTWGAHRGSDGRAGQPVALGWAHVSFGPAAGSSAGVIANGTRGSLRIWSTGLPNTYFGRIHTPERPRPGRFARGTYRGLDGDVHRRVAHLEDHQRLGPANSELST